MHSICGRFWKNWATVLTQSVALSSEEVGVGGETGPVRLTRGAESRRRREPEEKVTLHVDSICGTHERYTIIIDDILHEVCVTVKCKAGPVRISLV